MRASLERKPVLVTGASGFIGSRIVARLQAYGAHVHAVSRTQGHPTTGAVKWWQGDLAEAAWVRSVVDAASPRIIFHFAGEVTGVRDLKVVDATFRSGLMASVNVLLAAGQAGCERIVLAGSMEEPRNLAETPCSPYAAAKLAQNIYARMLHGLFGVPAVLMRIFMVYGPEQRDVNKLVPYVIRALLRGQMPRLTSGRREVDWIYVDDVVDAALEAATTPGIDGQSLDIGTGVLTSVRAVVEQLRDLIDPNIPLEFGALSDRPLERVDVADVETTARSLHWRPAVPLAEGLARTVRSVRRGGETACGRRAGA